jgi:hypothetical protein
VCIQTYALFLVVLENIQVGLIKTGMWMKNALLATLDIGGYAIGSGAASYSNPCSSSAEQASCSIFVDDDEDEDELY